MDKNKIARELFRAAKELTAGNISKKVLIDAVVNFVKRGNIYVVVEVVEGDGKRYRVSGNILRMSDWLSQMQDNEFLSAWQLVELTTNRNDARKMADEV